MPLITMPLLAYYDFSFANQICIKYNHVLLFWLLLFSVARKTWCEVVNRKTHTTLSVHTLSYTKSKLNRSIVLEIFAWNSAYWKRRLHSNRSATYFAQFGSVVCVQNCEYSFELEYETTPAVSTKYSTLTVSNCHMSVRPFSLIHRTVIAQANRYHCSLFVGRKH